MLEIRAGTGGDEATLFAAEIFRMYTRYAETQRWRVEVTSVSESAVGGLKEVIALVSGDKVYSQLKYESGVHRVQRVPATEQQGRVHTSAITVAVLPEADEVEVKIEDKDIRIDTFCSSGPGGQSVNTTYSAVRLRTCRRAWWFPARTKNRRSRTAPKAMRVLRSRLYEIELEKQQAQLGAERRSMVGTGDRSEKIRTYNFPQNRVTDHRIGLDAAPARPGDGRQARPDHRSADHALPDREAEAGRRSGVIRSDHSHRAPPGHEAAREDVDIVAPRLTAEVLLCHAFIASAPTSTPTPSRNCVRSNGSTTAAICMSGSQGKPTQYITNRQEFYGREFRVTPDVLIPRPETEHVVEAAIKLNARRIVDVGCGSGAIAVTLALETRRTILRRDFAHRDRIAAANARKLGARVEFLVCDLLSAVADSSINVVVSNPPYVPFTEKANLQREVRDWEPHAALFAGPTGLEIYERLIPKPPVCFGREAGW